MPYSAQYKTFNTMKPEDKIPDVPSCIDCTDLDQRKKLVNSNQIVCIDLYANWCEPCKFVGPKFNELSHRYNTPGKCLLFKENIDLGLTSDYDVTGIPAFIFYTNGQILRNQDGSPFSVVGGDIDKVQNVLDRLLGRV